MKETKNTFTVSRKFCLDWILVGQYTGRPSEFKLRLIRSSDATYDALLSEIPFKWNDDEYYDTVNPFGDLRQIDYDALWTFDIANDVLRYTNCSRCSHISLSLLRRGGVSLADMEALGGPVPDPLTPTFDPATQYWEPQVEKDDRTRAFTNRVLLDFNHQWRHILRNRYNSTTLRVLARAIIRLATLDFEVREETGGRHGQRGSYVWITKLPPWEPFAENIVPVGNVNVVVCQSLDEGLAMAQEHFSSHEKKTTERATAILSMQNELHYMVLSIKHIMLCHASDSTKLKHTAPEALFNGNHGTGHPSELALDYLLWATASARRVIRTPLQSLPVEVQDMILEHVSAGTVAAAKVGCSLGLGSPFLWKDGPLSLTLEETWTFRMPGMPVESQIWFGEQRSGIVYLGRRA
jgi:hypothetical protein